MDGGLFDAVRIGKKKGGTSIKRDLRLDNLKCLLIFLVVLCHLMVEFVNPRGSATATLYQVVYVFHMPAFVFVTGYFARFNPKKILAGTVLPYVTFQVLAIVWKNVVAGRMWSFGLTLLYPQWTLWYLLACALWCCSVPLLQRVTTNRRQAGVVAATAVLSLAAGFAPWLGSFLDLSRVVTLYPFFAAGWYAGIHRLSARIGSWEPARLRRYRIASALCVLAFVLVQLRLGGIPKEVLYRDAPYAGIADFWGRLFVQTGAVLWCAFVFAWTIGRNLGVVSVVGRNTMGIYLLHTWAIRALRQMPPLPGGELTQILACALLDIVILLLLGNGVVGQRFVFVMGGGWLKRGRTEGT